MDSVSIYYFPISVLNYSGYTNTNSKHNYFRHTAHLNLYISNYSLLANKF